MAYKPNPAASGGEENRNEIKSVFSADGKFVPYVPAPKKGLPIGTPYKPVASTLSFGSNIVNDDLRKTSVRLPGIAQIRWVPTWGVSKSTNDGLGQAGLEFISEIQKILKGRNLSFEGPDVIIQLQAFDSLVCLFNLIKRAYKSRNYRRFFNAYTPGYLMYAQGIDYDSVIDNASQIREDLAYWAAAINNYAVPKVFHAFSVHEAMTNYFYVDAISDKAQMYIPTLDGVWSYENVDEVKGLKYEQIPSATTYPYLKQLMNKLLAAAQLSADFTRINASIRSTYEDSDLFTVTTDDIDTLPVTGHDASFLEAIQNANIVPAVRESLRCYDDGSGYVKCEPYIDTISSSASDGFIKYNITINSINDDLDSADFANATRWVVAYDEPTTDDSGERMDIISMGTEVITEFNVIQPKDMPIYEHVYNDSSVDVGVIGGYGLISIGYDAVNVYGAGTSPTNDKLMMALMQLSAFKWHPQFKFIYTGSNGKRLPMNFTQWNYFTTVDEADIQSAHKALIWKALLND